MVIRLLEEPMRRYLPLIVLALLLCAPLAWAATSLTTPMGDVPDLTPQLEIHEPVIVHAGEPIPVEVAYKNFHADPSLRCGPAGACLGSTSNTVTGPPGGQVDVGHVHVYFTPGESSLGPVKAASFCIPATVEEQDFAGTLTGTCPALLEPGVYRVTAEFQSNSHVSSLKAANQPQHVPTSDESSIRVVGAR